LPCSQLLLVAGSWQLLEIKGPPKKKQKTSNEKTIQGKNNVGTHSWLWGLRSSFTS
jgi:hypothetical protein